MSRDNTTFNNDRTNRLDFTSNFSPKREEPTFFSPLTNTQQIPKAKYKSRTGEFAAKYIDTDIAEADRTGLNVITDTDHLKQEADLRTAIRTSLETDDGIDLDKKLTAAKLAMEQGSPARTVGQIYQRNTHPTKTPEVAKAIDKRILIDDNDANILTNIGEDSELTSVDAVLDTKDPEYSRLIADTALGKDEGFFEGLIDYLPEGSATRGLVEHFTKQPTEGALQPFVDADKLQSGLMKRLAEPVLSAVGLDKDASLRDVLEFVSFIPVDAKAEIDIQNAVKIVFSDDTLDGRLNRLSQWDSEFRAKYGEEGYTQMAAFMVKEGVVDAATLALALKSPKLAKKLLSDSRDKIWSRFTKALGRASVMGVGGTGVQASIDSYLGYETDILPEFALRTGGAFVGEGVARAIAATGKGILGVGSRLINDGAKMVGLGGNRASAVGMDTVVESVSKNLPQSASDKLVRDFGLEPKKTPDLATVMTEAADAEFTAPYRDLATQSLDSLRRGRQGSLGHIFDLSDSEIKAGALNNSVKREIMLGGVGNRLIGETITKQQAVDNVLNYHFDHGLRQVERRATSFTGDDSLFEWKSYASEPRNLVGGMADNVFDELLNKDVYQKALIDAQEVAFKGLSKKATNKTISIREKMEDLSAKNPDFEVTPEVLEMEGLTPDEIDAYYAVGKLLDFTAILSENTMISSAARRGLKQLPDGRIVKVIEEQSEFAAGHMKVQEVGVNAVEEIVPIKDVKDVTRIMGYKKNFVPRRPKDADYLLGVLDTKTGELNVKHASRYKSEIDDKLMELDAEFAGTSSVAFYWRNMTDEKSLNFGLAENSTSLIDSLDDASISKIRQALSSSENAQVKDLDIEQLRLAFDTLTYGSIASQQIAGKRGTQGLRTVTGEPFEYKPSDEAITQHLMEASALQFRDFRNDAINQFQKEFADVLDPTQNWNQEIPNILGKSDRVQRAKSVQYFITNNVFNETGFGKQFRAGVDAWADRMRRKGGRNKQMVDALERMPIVEQAFKQTRDGTAMFRAASSAMVFAGNVGSFVTQVAPSAAMIVGIKGITNPTHLIKGWTDMLGALSIRAGVPEKFASKESRAALKAIEQSGILSKAEVSDLANAAYGQSSTIFNKAMFFVQQGEKANRANIWLTIRAEMMAQAKKGQLPSLNGNRVLTAKDIDTTEFSQIVSEKAKQIFLDTTQAGRLKILSGAGSAIGQFAAPLIKTHTMWFAKGLSGREKIGASLGLFAFYGIKAVPYVAAAGYLANKGAEWVAGGDEIDDFTIVTDIVDNFANDLLDNVGKLAGFTEEDKEFFRTAVKKGGIAALTGGEVDLYNKMAMGLFIAETIEKTDDISANIPMVSILGRAAEGASNIGELLSDLWEAVYNPESEREQVKELRQLMGDILNETGNVLPGFGKTVDILNNHPDTRKYLNPELENLDHKGYVLRSGKRVAIDETPTRTQMMLNTLGITPRPVQENREVLSEQFDRVKILRKMKDKWTDRYKNAATDRARLRVMKDALAEAREAERVLMATYQGALNNAVGRSDDDFYKIGTMPKQWFNAFLRIDQERIAGNRTVSRGE